jgi:hypothetical protein
VAHCTPGHGGGVVAHARLGEHRVRSGSAGLWCASVGRRARTIRRGLRRWGAARRTVRASRRRRWRRPWRWCARIGWRPRRRRPAVTTVNRPM